MFRLVDAILESNLWPLAEAEKGNGLEDEKFEEVEVEGLEDLEEVSEEVSEEASEEVSEEASEEASEEVNEEVSEEEQEVEEEIKFRSETAFNSIK